jgi:hypothetical protein
MATEMIDALEIAERLSRRFGPEAGRELASVLDTYYKDLRESAFQNEFRQIREALNGLTVVQNRTGELLEALAEAQRRTEERVEALASRTDERLEALAQAQGRTGELLEALAEAQGRTEERVEALTRRTEERLEALAQAQGRTGELLEALAEAQRRTEERLEALARRIDERLEALVQAQGRTEEKLEALAEAQRRTEERLEMLIRVVESHEIRLDKVEVRLAKLDGRTLESQFREKASAYLGRVLRGTRVIPVGDLADDLEGVLTESEWEELIRADVVLKGRALLGTARQEVFVVVEISVTLDAEDVARAARRAALLRKKGWKSLAVAAGEEATAELIQDAARAGVAVLQDGRQFNWSEALASA